MAPHAGSTLLLLSSASRSYCGRGGPRVTIRRERASACVILGGVSRLVYVSGRLGAGKSSLAFPLAAELGYSLVTKDLVKETLHDALYVPGEDELDQAWSRRLGGASMELLWVLAACAGDMVIEANFHPQSEYELGKLHGLGDRVVEVHCACPAEVAVARYNARQRHEVHWLKKATLATMEVRPGGRHRPADHRGHHRAGRRRVSRRRGPPPARSLTPHPEPHIRTRPRRQSDHETDQASPHARADGR